MEEVIFADLPALPNNDLKFFHYVMNTIVPYWDSLNTEKSIKDVLNDVLFKDEPNGNVDSESSEIIEGAKDILDNLDIKSEKLKLDDDLDKFRKLGKIPIEDTIRQLQEPVKLKPSASKSRAEIESMLGHKIKVESVQSDEPVTKEPFNPNQENMLTGELIQLCKDVSERLNWYNEIDFGSSKSIVAKKTLKKQTIKFETKTITSYMNRFNTIFGLLLHHDYPIDMLSSKPERTYETIYTEFQTEYDLMKQIALVDEMRMIPSSWLPKQEVFMRRKRVTPVIAGKTKGSADKSEA